MVCTLELRATQDGVIWPRRPLVSAKGLLAVIKNLPFSVYDKKSACFRAVTFSAAGDVIAASDEKGRVFVFYVTSNRYALVQHLGVPTVACCFSPTRKSELLITCENEMIRCLDVHSQSLICTLRGHRVPARSASFQKSGKLALTASQDAVILWDTKDWSRYRVLNAGPGVEAASFVSRGDLVAVCFQDDSIMMWELESLALRYRFSLPDQERPAGLKTITVSDDYKILVATGRSQFIYVWDFESQTIIRIIELPPPIEEVVHHAFVPGHDSMISILGSDGSLFFLNVSAKKPKINLEISHRGRKITSYEIESHGRYLAASTDDGCLLIYDMDIAGETAKRVRDLRKEQGLAEFESSLHLRTRSVLGSYPSSPEAPRGVVSEHTKGSPGPASSKLIDTIFGPKSKKDKVGALHDDDQNHNSANLEGNNKPVVQSTPLRVTQSSSRTRTMEMKTDAPVVRPIKQRSVLTMNDLSEEEIEINRKRLEGTLRCHGVFPAKYRVLAWRFLLRLPKNENAFKSLLTKGPHPNYIKLHETYPLKNRRLFRRLHRVLSAIAYWCPAFGEVSYLPAVVYPFIKIYRENDIAAFETSLCVLLHWCRSFLSSLPYPPVFVLSELEFQLEKLDPQLHDHFVKHNVNAEVYAWSLLKSIFTEVFSDEEWMCLWDHLFTYPDQPQLLQVAVLAYLSYFRTSLLAAGDRYSMEQFFHQQNAVRIQSFVQLIVNLSKKVSWRTPTFDEQDNSVHWPLSRGQYPAFANYPKFIVDFQIAERNRIALEEAEMLQKKKLLERVERESERLKTEHKKWLDQRHALIAAEEKRRADALAAEKHRILSLKTLDHETRKRRLDRLAELERIAQETLDGTSRLFQAEYERVDLELMMMKERTEFEISSRKQEEELQQMEFDTERRVLEIHKQRETEERIQQLRAEFLTRIKQNELHDLLTFENWKRADEKKRRKAKMEVERREKLSLLQQEKNVRQQLENKLLDHIVAKEQELLGLQTQRRAREDEEHEFENLESEMEEHERELARLQLLNTQNGDMSLPADVPARPHEGSKRGGQRRTTAAHSVDTPMVRSQTSSEVNVGNSSPGVQHNETSGERKSEDANESVIRLNDSDAINNVNVSNSLDQLEKARRRLSTLLNESRDESDGSNSDEDEGDVLFERSKEDLTLLEKALEGISSGSSSSSISSKSSVGKRSSKRSGASSLASSQEGHALGRSALFGGISPVTSLARGRTAHQTTAISELQRPESLPDLESVNETNDEEKLNDSTHSSATPHTSTKPHTTSDVSSSVDGDQDDESSILQRPIEELEKELGIKFDDLSDDDDGDSDDDQLEDDRAQLLMRARKLLQEQSMLSDADDETHGQDASEK